MARHVPDTFASPTVSPPTSAEPTPDKLSTSVQHDSARIAPIASRALAIISVLSGLALGTLLALAFAGPAPERLQQDAELASLVRTMVLVKGLFLVAALSLVSWRLARPAARLQLVGYSASLGLSAAALAWMWSLNAIPIAALLFYSGLIACFLTASRDGQLLAAHPKLTGANAPPRQ